MAKGEHIREPGFYKPISRKLVEEKKEQCPNWTSVGSSYKKEALRKIDNGLRVFLNLNISSITNFLPAAESFGDDT